MTETVLVTGASSGIGLELARLFAADGSHLILVARNEERLNAVASALRSEHGIEARVIARDLTEAKAREAIFDELTREGTPVDVLVNNAGFGLRGDVASLPVDEQMDMVQLNVAAPTHLTRLFLPGMLERGRGGILNVSSVAGFQPGPHMCVYYATKAYLLHFSEGLAEEVSGAGVTVSCLAPGATATRFPIKAGTKDSLLFRLGAYRTERIARAGYRAYRKGKVIEVPGAMHALTRLGVRLTPRAIVRKVAGLFQKRLG